MEIKDTKIKNIIKCTAKAAITIEATISLTLFMFVVVFLAGFITAVDKQLSIQIKTNRLAENMAKQMFYIKQVDEITDYSEKLKEYKDKFKENISEMKDTLPESNLIKDDYIDMVYTYDYKLPVLSKTITITQRAKVKDWTGTDMTKDYELVYITKYGNVYHSTKECSHLILYITGTEYGKVGEARNEQGEKYTPCEFCGNKKISDTTTVFITADGNRYHTNLQCSGITRNIIEIDIKEVDNRKPCSSCNGG